MCSLVYGSPAVHLQSGLRQCSTDAVDQDDLCVLQWTDGLSHFICVSLLSLNVYVSMWVSTHLDATLKRD